MQCSLNVCNCLILNIKMVKTILPARHGPIFSDSVTPFTEANTGDSTGHKHYKNHQEGQEKIQEGMKKRAAKRCGQKLTSFTT